jgi:acetyl-CoA carboxylase carboxyl transferase subunit alpha
MSNLEFEKPITELKNKINELKKLAGDANIDFTSEIISLENRLSKLEDEIYTNLQPWDKVTIARLPQRPTTLDYIPLLFENFMEFHGDRLYGDDAAIVGGIATFHGMPVTVIGQQRGRDTKENIKRNFAMPHPEGYRKALRLMKQANKFKRPIITFIDTKGAYPGKAAEERGQSEAIARNLFEMAGMDVPIICIVIGEGGSGGALALGVANRILMLENSTYSVISPEGAAALLWKDSALARKAAETMKITAEDLKDLHIVDEIIPEVRGGAHNDLKTQAKYMNDIISRHLFELLSYPADSLANNRFEKYANIGFVQIDEDNKKYEEQHTQ